MSVKLLPIEDRIRDAQERFDAADPQVQYFVTVMRKANRRHAVMRRANTSTTLEEAVREDLTREVSAKYADYLLADPVFRVIMAQQSQS